MDTNRIYPILDFILNHADADELAAVKAALARREKQRGYGGLDIGNVARETSRDIEGQIGGSIDSIRDMIRNFAVEMIVKEAPDIPEEHLNQLINAWIPTPDTRSMTEKGVPGEVLLEMIRQFVAAGTGQLDAGEKAALEKEFGDWEEIYWNRFPEPVRKTIRKYLKNEIDNEMFQAMIQQILLSI